MHCEILYQSKKKTKTAEIVWVLKKKKKKEGKRHRQGCLQKVWNAFPQKQYACGKESFQERVPLLVGYGFVRRKQIKKKKKKKWVHFRARVNAHVRLAAMRLHNSVASKNTVVSAFTPRAVGRISIHIPMTICIWQKAVPSISIRLRGVIALIAATTTRLQGLLCRVLSLVFFHLSQAAVNIHIPLRPQ